MHDTTVEVEGLRKAFGANEALRGLDLSVAEGQVVALIGPNGSGKTTTIRILATLLRPDGGRAAVAGHDVTRDPGAVRAAIGVTGQFSAVDGLLTGRENVALMADLHHLGRDAGRRRAEELLELLDLTEAAGRPAVTYSGGMRRRLDLAMTLVGRPRVVFLDEPTTGLDPRGRRVLWQLVRDLVAGGTTVLLTTQYLDEADRLADRVALIDHGSVAAEGTPDELKSRCAGGQIRIRLAHADGLAAAVRALPGGRPGEDGCSVVVATDGTLRALRAVLDRLEDHRVAVESLAAQPPDLDDVFLALTGSAGVSRAEVEVAS